MSQFDITKKENPQGYEELGLHFEFYEKKIRGSNTTECVVQATEEGPGIEVHSFLFFKNWQELKKQYPTLKSILVDFSNGPYWFANWRDRERLSYVASVQGNEGLYDVNKTVFYDYQDDSDMIEFEEPKKSVKKMKK